MTSLDQRFYRDAEIYEAEVERIFMNCWLYAGHVSEIPETGDWFLYELDRESVIVVRATDDRVNALANVCRHRGSRVCLEAKGSGRRLTCRYHGWTYGLDGTLRNIPLQESFGDINPDDLGLRPVPTEVRGGIIWVPACAGTTIL